MRMNKSIVVIFATAILSLIASPHAFSGEFQREGKIFIASSAANVRTEPDDAAPIAGKLPIGTNARFAGSTSASVFDAITECTGTATENINKWSCICLDDLPVEDDGLWCGWTLTDLLAKDKPTLSDLIAKYDKTPPNELPERRKWAERAAALDPMSAESQDRLLDVLKKMNDVKALEGAKRSFANYAKNKPLSEMGEKLIFTFSGGHLEPIAEIKNGEIVFSSFDANTNYEFRDRGHFFNLYSHGLQIDTVVTETQFNCLVETCPTRTIARLIGKSEIMNDDLLVATNFSLRQRNGPSRRISAQDEAILLDMANAWIDASSWPIESKEKLRAYIGQEDSGALAVGMLDRDGRVMLIANFSIGSMDAQHYGSEEDIYESLLIIAEQQDDGTFQQAAGSGSIAGNGCLYFDNIDIDDDGTDEIFLACAQLEGSYSYGMAKRVGDRWLTQ